MANNDAKKLSAPPPGYPGGAVADNKNKEKDNNAKAKEHESTAEVAAAAAADGEGDKERGLRIHIDVGGGGKSRTHGYGYGGLYSEGVGYSQAQEFGGGGYRKQQAAAYDREYSQTSHAHRLQQAHGFAPPPVRRPLGAVAAGIRRQEYSCTYDEYDNPSNMKLRYNYEAGYDNAAEDDIVVTMGGGGGSGRRYEHGGYATSAGAGGGGRGYQKAWKESNRGHGHGHAQMMRAQNHCFEQEMEYAESGHGQAQLMHLESHGGAMSDDEYYASKPAPQPCGYYAVQEEYCKRY